MHPDPINVFQNTPIDANGNYVMAVAATKPGDYIEFRCEIDLIVVLTACSVDIPINGIFPNGLQSTPLRIDIRSPILA